MAIYEFQCPQCKQVISKKINMKSKNYKVECTCGYTLTRKDRRLNSFGVVYKCSGFHCKDYAGGNDV